MVRIKERYLLVNILYPVETPPPRRSESGPAESDPIPDLVVYHQPTTSTLTESALAKGLRAEVGVLFGDYGRGALQAGMSVKYLSHATSTAIIKVQRAHYRILWAGLTCMDRVPVRDGRPCVFRVVHVSGTIKKVEEEAVRRARLLILAVNEHRQQRRQRHQSTSSFLTTPSRPAAVAAAAATSADSAMVEVDGDSAQDSASGCLSDLDHDGA